MSWVSKLSTSMAAAGAMFALAAPDMARADVVVASSGPSAGQFPAGKKLNATDQITLKTGDTVTVLGSAGTRVITGAGAHRVGARGTAKNSTFAILTRQRAATRQRTGAVRGDLTGQPLTRPNIWYVDVTRSGTMCISADAAVQLWRPSTEGAPTFMVASMAPGAAAPLHMHLAFAEGTTTTDWDLAQMPLENGATYNISGPGGDQAVDVTFALLDNKPDTAEDLAQILIAKGCTGQLDLLATALM